MVRSVDQDTVETIGRNKIPNHINYHIIDSSDWKFAGNFQAIQYKSAMSKIEVTNLLPNAIYQFKIAALNGLGLSKFSQLSAPVTYNIEHLQREHALGVNKFKYSIYGVAEPSKNGISRISCDGLDTTVVAESTSAFQQGQFHASCVELDLGVELLLINGQEVEIWRSHFSPSMLSVKSSVVFAVDDPFLSHDGSIAAVPLCETIANVGARNYSEYGYAQFLNDSIEGIGEDTEVSGRILVALRGKVPFHIKAQRAQREGALALLVVGDGSCSEYNQACLPGANKWLKQGFGAMDVPSYWENIHIPVVFLLRSAAVEVFASLTPPFSLNGLPQFWVDILSSPSNDHYHSEEL